MKHALKKRGFTLVELLVVVAIMGMLFGLVVISNRPSRKTQLRQAAQSIASLVIAAQSNALESEIGSAMWIADDGIYDANPQQHEFRQLSAVSNVTATSCQLDGITVPTGACRVRFVSTASSAQPPSPWFDIVGQTAKFFSPAQTPYNTVWPARFYTYPSDPQARAEFDLTPVKAGLAYQWPKLAKIDWRYSGIGNTAPLPAESALAFAGSGNIGSFLTGTRNTAGVNPALSTLYLCIAYAPDVGEDANLNGTLETEDANGNGELDPGEDSNGNNVLDTEDVNGNGALDPGSVTLLNEDTVWVAIEPGTCRVSLGWNEPLQNLAQGVIPTGSQLQSARANVIAGKGLAD